MTDTTSKLRESRTVTTLCLNCEIEFTDRISNKRIYCSRSCRMAHYLKKYGDTIRPEARKKQKAAVGARSKKRWSENSEYREKMRQSTLGDRNFNWKGDEASYGALHKWVYARLGKAKECVNCKIPNLKLYQWSNISGEYKRDLTDWQQLCVKCHRQHDKSIKGAMEKRYGKS